MQTKAEKLAYCRAWKAANKEKVAAQNKAYREANKEKAAVQQKAWKEANKEQIRDQGLQKKYGITLADYEDMLEAQDGHCAICPKTPAEEHHSVLHVDHNHETGEVRGLLCNSCNKGLGHLGDSTEILTSALQYLLKKGSYSK